MQRRGSRRRSGARNEKGPDRPPASRRRTGVLLATAAVLAALALAACGSSSSKGPVILNWYVFPEPSGSFASAAQTCSKNSGGAYNIKINFLSTSSDQQRVSLVRRLAANDSSIDILAMDVDWTSEFAAAKWIRPVPSGLVTQIKAVDLPGPITTATYEGALYGVPINSNTQLLWYRKDLLAKIGQPVPTTWEQMFADSEQLQKKGQPHYIEVQGAQYEGLTVWFNTLVNSAGGQIVAGHNQVVINHTTETAATIMRDLATGPGADPSLNVSNEGTADTAFDQGKAAFELNYPFVWASAQSTNPTVAKQMGYAAFPQVTAGLAPRVSIGGYNLAVSTHATHPQLAFNAISCLTQQQNEITYATKGGLAPVRGAVYHIPSFIKLYPFAALIEKQLRTYGIRPQTPAYADVTLAIQKTLSPTSNINPTTVVNSLRSMIKASLTSSALL